MKDCSVVKSWARLVVWTVMLLLLSCPVNASELSELSFRTVTTFDGLSSNIVNAIFRDQRGFVWLGTQTGLDRFDGITVLAYPQFAGHTILSLVETDSIYLWVGTDAGLFCFNRKTEKVEPVALQDRSVRVNALHYDVPTKRLWVITDHGLFIVCDGQTRQVLFGENAFSLDNQLSGIAKGEGNEFWITSQESLIRYNAETGVSEVYYVDVRNPSSDVNRFSCLALSGETVYIGTRNAGVFCFDRKTRSFSKFAGMQSGDVKQLMIEGKDTLYVGCNGNGIQVFHIPTGRKVASMLHSTRDGGICSSAVYAFLKADGLFFIGSYMGGFCYTPMRGNLFSTYSWNEVFHSSGLNVRTFYIDEEKGNKVVGTRDGLYFLSEQNNRLLRYTQRNSILRSDIILFVSPVGEDYLVGTYRGGLYVLSSESGQLSFFGEERSFKEESFSASAVDSKGNIWIGSSSGLYQYNSEDKKYKSYDNRNSSLSHHSIFSVFVDSSDRIWVGTSGALYMYNERSGIFENNLFPKDILPYAQSIRYIYEDKEHNLWFCDDKEGVIKADSRFTRFQHFTTDDFLPNNSVSSIVESPDGKGLWFATQGGLLYVDKKSGLSKRFSLYDGLPGYVFNNAVQVTPNHTLWWGNERGLVSFRALGEDSGKREDMFSVICPPVLTSIVVAGEPQKAGSKRMPYAVSYTEEISLSHAENNIAFSFSALNYAERNTMLYEYFLEGYDKKWHTLSGKNQVTYTNLPTGHYVFKVCSSSTPEAVRTLRITVEPDYKSYAWGGGVILCGLLALVWAGRKYVGKKVLLSPEGKEEVSVPFENGNSELPKEKYQKSKMDDKTAAEIEKNLRECMLRDKLYLNPNLKLQDVAAAIGHGAVEVSQTLNVFMNTNFTDFVNQYRVETFVERVKQGDTAKFTLASLSEECGFSSRTSFFRSFRKLKGMSPSEYLKSDGKSAKKI